MFKILNQFYRKQQNEFQSGKQGKGRRRDTGRGQQQCLYHDDHATAISTKPTATCAEHPLLPSGNVCLSWTAKVLYVTMSHVTPPTTQLIITYKRVCGYKAMWYLSCRWQWQFGAHYHWKVWLLGLNYTEILGYWGSMTLKCRATGTHWDWNVEPLELDDNGRSMGLNDP